MKKLLQVLAFLLTAIALQAQTPQTSRYHFGDDPDGKLGWANPNFDDSAWPASQSGQWPIPALFSNGFMWVRTRLLVQSDAEGPLAIRLLNASLPLADEIFVNGVSVGKQGSFPPRVRYTRETVFDLPAGLTAPERRLWSRFASGIRPSRTASPLHRPALDSSSTEAVACIGPSAPTTSMRCSGLALNWPSTSLSSCWVLDCLCSGVGWAGTHS